MLFNSMAYRVFRIRDWPVWVDSGRRMPSAWWARRAADASPEKKASPPKGGGFRLRAAPFIATRLCRLDLINSYHKKESPLESRQLSCYDSSYIRHYSFFLSALLRIILLFTIRTIQGRQKHAPSEKMITMVLQNQFNLST